MPSKSASVKNEKQYEKLKERGMSKSRAARIANSPGASSRGGKKSGSGSSAKQGGTRAEESRRQGGQGGSAQEMSLGAGSWPYCEPHPESAALIMSGRLASRTEDCPRV
jgi:hypothetical protein